MKHMVKPDDCRKSAEKRSPRTGGLFRGRGDEVDELLDAAEQGGFQVGVGADARQDALPRITGLDAPAEGGDDALLPRDGARHRRPRRDPDRRRLDRGPDVDERVAGDEDVRRGHLGGDPALLGPFDEMVDEDAEPPSGPWAELVDDRRKIVDAFEVLHDDALDSQIVAPDPLHELRVVYALHVDAALLGHLGAQAGYRDRPGRRPEPSGRSPGRTAGSRPDQGDRPALQQEPGLGQRENAALAEPVLERDRVLLTADHRAAEPARRVLDDQVALGRY